MVKEFFNGIFRKGTPEPIAPPQNEAQKGQLILLDQLPESMQASAYENPELSLFTGQKFFGGLNAPKIYDMDYWQLRLRSKELFIDNLYARGIISRYVTNIINTGLMAECTPEEGILGLEEGTLGDWSEDVENRFNLWAKSYYICDYERRQTYYALQAQIKLEALVYGDVLVVIRIDPETKMPNVEIINAGCVQTPPGNGTNRKIVEGVEINARREQVAYHIMQEDGGFKRLPAFNKGHRQAFLVYGTKKLHCAVRGEPLLSIIIQSLKEIDRYRDSTQRKAVINSMIAMWIKQTQNKPSSLPMTGGAVKNSSTQVTDATVNPKTRNFTVSNQLPGMVLQDLQYGEEPEHMTGNGTDLNFGPFEQAIVDAMAWCLEAPPEILKLAFSSNYSASQAATNEFKMFLNKERTWEGAQLNQHVFDEFFFGAVMSGKIRAPGFLSAWNNLKEYDIYGAWTAAQWAGAIKPSVDPVKQGKAYEIFVNNGWCTNDRASKELTGTKYSKNIKQLERENQQKADALRPLKELEAEFGPTEQREEEPEEPEDNEDNDK